MLSDSIYTLFFCLFFFNVSVIIYCYIGPALMGGYPSGVPALQIKLSLSQEF